MIVFQLIEELRRELENLQLYKLDMERTGRSRRLSTSLSDYSTRTRESDLEQEMKRLKQVRTLSTIFHFPPLVQLFNRPFS